MNGMWIGDEIEGSYSRQKTLFIEAEELDKHKAKEFIEIAKENECQMIYLGAGSSVLDNRHWRQAAKLLELDDKMTITAELFLGKNEGWFSHFRSHAEGYLSKRLHIILTMPHIDSDVLRKLRESDDIKIQEGSIGRLWTWAIGSAASVCDYPEDYKDDVVV
jgi:hypothetical protein